MKKYKQTRSKIVIIYTCRTASFGPIPGLQKTLELREAIFSPEMIWEAVPQCRCSKSERFFYRTVWI